MRDRRWWLTLPLQLKHTLHIATSHNILPRCFRWHACRFSTPSSTTVVFSCEGIGRCRPHRRLGEEIGVLSRSQSNAITTTVPQGKPPATSVVAGNTASGYIYRVFVSCEDVTGNGDDGFVGKFEIGSCGRSCFFFFPGCPPLKVRSQKILASRTLQHTRRLPERRYIHGSIWITANMPGE